MGKVEIDLRDFENFETLPFSKSFCPFESSKNIPVFCDRECALFTVQKEYGIVKFAGCSIKWVALCSHRGLLPVLP